MAKIKNLTLSFKDAESLTKMKEEYLYIGREVTADYRKLELKVLALPKTYKKKQEREAKLLARKSDEDDYEAYSKKYNKYEDNYGEY